MNILLLCFLFLTKLYACDDSWIIKGIDLTINNQFDQAITLFNNEIQKTQDNYRAYFYLAAALNSKMTHWENWDDEPDFEKTIDKTIDIIEVKLKEENNSDSLRSRLLFYLGSAYGYRAYYKGQLGKWLPALSNGIKASNLLNQATDLDSTVYDAYLGIGTYKYWRYTKLKFISWFPLIPDDREEGIEMIKKAAKHSRYSRYMAMHQLVYILLDYGKTEEALLYAEQLVQKYPESQFMWWAKAHALLKNRDYEQAEQAYLKLIQLINIDPNRNDSHLLNCKLKLAYIYLAIENPSACERECKEILSIAQNMSIKSSDEKRIVQTRDLLKECQSLTINTSD